MCFEVLEIFFEYNGRPWTETIFKFMEKLVFVPFSCVTYLLFRYYDYFNFLVCKSVFYGLSKELVVSTALHQCLVLLPPTFTQNFTSFDLDEFSQFRVLLKLKGQSGKKIVNSRNFLFIRTLITMCFRILEKIFEYRGRAWTGTIFKFIEKMFFVPFSWVIYLLFQYYDHMNLLVCKRASFWLSRVSCRYCTASMSGFIATYFYAKFHQFWPRRNFPFWGALKTEVTVWKKNRE